MAANGISTLATKTARQIAKLDLSAAKRKGRVITEAGGSWSDDGVDNDAANWYRPNNDYDLTSLPNIYIGNQPADPDANPNPGGLIPKRPWIAVGVIAEPASIAEAVDGTTLPDLQVWYDGADLSTYIPNATDEGQITQWTDKSNFAHNANPNGGTAKPTYENTDTTATNGHGYLEFDGNDNLSINPFTAVTSASAFTIFIVGALGTTTGTQYFGSTNNGGLSIFSNGTNFAANVAGDTATGTTAIDTDWHIHTLVYNGSGTSLLYRLDKNDEATAIPGGSTQATSDTYYIGARDPSTSNLTGYVGEVIMFNRVLSPVEYANVENYLATKWGL